MLEEKDCREIRENKMLECTYKMNKAFSEPSQVSFTPNSSIKMKEF